MEINHLIIGDVIRYNDANVYYNNCVGRVVKYGPQAQRIVEFRIGEDYEQISLPAGNLKGVELVYRAPRDTDIVKEYVENSSDWDGSVADGQTIREVVESGSTKWNEAANEIDNEIEGAINPEYESREDAAEDIFGDKTAARLKALREKYHIPAPDNDIIDALKKREEEN